MSRHKWTEEDDQKAVELIKQGKSNRAISEVLGCSPSIVQEKMKAHFGVRKKKYIWVAFTSDGEMILAARTARDIGEVLLMPEDTIDRREARYRKGQTKSKLVVRYLDDGRDAEEIIKSGEI